MKAFFAGPVFEFSLIAIVICLMILFLILYFRKNKQYKHIHSKISKDNPNEKYLFDLKIAERLQFYEAKLELYESVGSVGIVIFDYEPEAFYIDKTGLLLLGYETELSRDDFENIIHEDDKEIYNSIFECENIKYFETSENSHIIRIKNTYDNEERPFLFKARPLYNSDGNILILICAFVAIS